MNKLFIVLIYLIIFLPNAVLSETISFKDLVYRNGLYYKKFTDVPFTGKEETYFKSGQLLNTGYYKDGKQHGLWLSYHNNGQLEYKGHYKNGEEDGLWVSYHNNGQLEYRGHYKNGEEVFD